MSPGGVFPTQVILLMKNVQRARIRFGLVVLVLGVALFSFAEALHGELEPNAETDFDAFAKVAASVRNSTAHALFLPALAMVAAGGVALAAAFARTPGERAAFWGAVLTAAGAATAFVTLAVAATVFPLAARLHLDGIGGAREIVASLYGPLFLGTAGAVVLLLAGGIGFAVAARRSPARSWSGAAYAAMWPIMLALEQAPDVAKALFALAATVGALVLARVAWRANGSDFAAAVPATKDLVRGGA